IITEVHVKQAKNLIEHNKLIDAVMTLPIQQQKVLEAITYLTKKHEEITSGRLYEVYEDLAKNDKVSYRRIFDFINELELLGLISANTVSRGRGKGRTNIITLQCDPDLVEDNLYKGK
ncbi:MAG: cell division control protein Cdc6, partial [Methanosphaera sp.]|nr:cell division control protein Cdc6 [Methanosphaera sp.]